MPDLGKLIADLSSGDLVRAESAAQQINQIDPEDSLPALEELYQDTNRETRWWAVRALAELPAEVAGEALARALGDNFGAVRQCAALALRERPYAPAVPALVDMLSDADSLTARLASDALVAAGEEATSDLIEVLERRTGAAQVEAARALALIGDRRAIGPLFQALDCGSVMVKHWASEGLDRMGLGMRFFDAGS